MKPLVLIPIKPNIDFISRKTIFYVFSIAIIVASIALIAVRGLNLGIDFQGGILIEVRTPEAGQLAQMRGTLGGLGLGEVALQEFGNPRDVLIRVQKQEGGEQAQQAAVTKVKDALGQDVEYRRTEFVGPQVSEELFRAGIISIVLAMTGILAYIWFRFEWQFGVCGIIALLHDTIATVGVFALTGIEFNLSTVAAVLTIAGYSINDTVVVFDRVRENLRKYKTLSLPQLLNQSINETLSRTVITGVTTLLALLALYTLGGEVIRSFSFALIFGIIIGTYSSICLAVPLLLHLSINRGAMAAQESATGNEKAAPRT